MAADELSELMASLRADGELESEGHFTLDREQARKKMQKFQLADARRYVLELVQAAVLRGAQKIAFEIDADDMHLYFDGQPFRADEIDDLYGSLFRPGDSRELRAVRQLALGLNAALGMAPKHIHLRSGNVELRAQPGRPDEIIEHEQVSPRTHIHVRKPPSLRLIADFFANLTGTLAEEQYLRERCFWTVPAVFLDNRRISKGVIADDSGLAAIRLLGPAFEGRLQLEGSEPTRVHLIKDGVWIDSRDLPDCGTGIVAVVMGEQLRKDVSQAKIVDDAALADIVAAIRKARWALWRKAQQGAKGGQADRIRTAIHTQLLEHASFWELRDDPDARALAGTVGFADSRGPDTQLTLSHLIDAVADGQPLRYANARFPELLPEGAPVLMMRQSEAQRIGRALGAEVVAARELLQREQLRARGRAEWSTREAPARLPEHLQLNHHALIEHALIEIGDVRGEVGIDHQAMAAGLEHPAQVMLHLQGCLLGRLELDLDIPNIWLVIEAEFEPTDDYRDAIRDKTFTHALICALLSLAEPLAAYAEAVRELDSQAAGARGLIKRWLIALLDQRSQAALLTKAGADVSRKHYIDATKLLPSLSREGLLGEPAIARQPLFGTLDGSYLSLAELARGHRQRGHVLFLDARPSEQGVEAPGVPVLGPGDRKIVHALFGGALQPFDIGPQLRKLEFLHRPLQSAAELREELLVALRSASVRAEDWLLELNGPAHGCMVPAYAQIRHERLGKAGYHTSVWVVHEGRRLCELELQLGLGPLIAVVEYDALRVNDSWDGIVEDDAWQRVTEQLRASCDAMFERLVALAKDEVKSVSRWVTRVLLHAIAKRAAAGELAWLSLARELPMLECMSNRTITLAEAGAIIEQHGKLEVVARNTSWAPVDPPEIVKLDGDEQRELAQIFGKDNLGSGEPRVRHQRAFAVLSRRPEMTEATLGPGKVLVSMSLDNRHRRGEVGIARNRDAPGLFLRLGSAGRHINDIHSSEDVFWLPLDAVVLDNDMPLLPSGAADEESKHFKSLERQLHRMIPALVVALCQALPQLEPADVQLAWPRLLAYLTRDTGNERRQIRQRAFEAASNVAGFVDLWGQSLSLRDVIARAADKQVRTLGEPPSPPPPAELAGELILRTSEAERACLRAHLQVIELDGQWPAELERMRKLVAMPPLERPKLQAIALTQRKAAVAGGLECELWLPRDWSPLESGAPLQLDLARKDRRVDRVVLCEVLPCAGIVEGSGLVTGVQLDPRQRASLLRQLLVMYLDLAQRIAAGRLSNKDEPLALAYLSWAQLGIERGGGAVEELGKSGKHLGQLSALLSTLISPTLRAALRGPEPEPEPEPEPPPAVSAPTPAPAPEPVPPPRALTPSERLVAALWEQLRWASERHRDVLDALRLNRIELHELSSSAIAEVKLIGVAVNINHPLIQRLVHQDPIDPIDLTFAVAAIYALLNRVAEDITDDDEREFVAQLTESLVLAKRAERL